MIHLTIITFVHCSVVHCLCSLYHWPCKHGLPGVMSGLCSANQWCYTALCHSLETIFDENGCLHMRFKFTVNWSAVACLLCLVLHTLLPFVDDVFSSEFHASIMWDTIMHETSASWVVFISEAPAKHAPTLIPLSKTLRSLATEHAIIIGNQACAAFLYMKQSMLRSWLLN